MSRASTAGWILAIAWITLASAAAAQDPRIRVTLLGDSITNGIVIGGGTGWGEILGGNLLLTHVVDNIGCGGTSSTDWTLSSGGILCGNQIESDLIFNTKAIPSFPSDFVTIMLGTNDSVGFFEPEPVLPLLYRANLEEIIDNSLASGARTVILNSPPPRCGPSQASYLLGMYRAHAIDICLNDPDVLCGADVFTLLSPSDFVNCDPHPTESGHLKIFFAVRNVLLAHEPREPAMEVFQWEAVPELGGRLVFPVVTYSDANFDATAELDESSLTFGAGGFEDSLVWAQGVPLCAPVDVDGDGFADLTCLFDVSSSGLDLASHFADLRARTPNGSAVDAQVQGWAHELLPFPPALRQQLVNSF